MPLLCPIREPCSRSLSRQLKEPRGIKLSLLTSEQASETEGMLKLVFASDTLRLLGVHSLGDIAAELVALGQVVIQFKRTGT
jgi:pyruvate/2-oxoglutarate dehydrogenase complex dihydrolipoamide dehydrogenase (E3) component